MLVVFEPTTHCPNDGGQDMGRTLYTKSNLSTPHIFHVFIAAPLDLSKSLLHASI